MAKFPRRTAVVVAFAAALLGGALIPSGVAAAGSVPAPVLTGPADDTTTPLKDVVLTWDAVPGASGYQVQVSPNGEWTNNTVTLPDKGVTLNDLYEMPLSLPHDTYFWRVRANVGSTWGAFSAPRQFLREWAAPLTILHAPTGANPSVSWAPVQDASLYLVRFGTSSTFDTAGSDKMFACFTHQTSYTPYDLTSSKESDPNPSCFGGKELTDSTDYYWQVVPLDDSTAPIIDSETAPDPNYQCAQAQPECDADSVEGGPFTYTAPVAGVVSGGSVTGLKASWHTTSTTGTTCDSSTPCPITPTLSWNPVTGANFYHVQIFRDPGLTNTFRAYDTQWPTITPRDSFPDAQAGKPYYWAVSAGTCTTSTTQFCDANASDSVTDPTVFSTVQTFAKTSGTVDLTTPADAATVHGRSVTFNWSDFQTTGGNGTYDARNYALEVAKNDSFNHPVINVNDIDMTRYTDPAAPLHDGTYFWRVAPIDQTGNVLTWSTTRRVTVNASGPAIAITNKNGVNVSGPLTIRTSEPISGVSAKTVKVVPAGESAKHAVAGSLKLGASSTTYEFRPKHPLATGGRYNLVVSPTLVDDNGNSAVVAGNGVRTAKVAHDTSKGWTYHHKWSRTKASGAHSGSYKSAKSGASASLHVVGSNATLYACEGPSMGKITVSLNGKSHLVNEHQSFTKCGVAVWHEALPSGQNTITVKVTKGTGNLDEVAVK